MIYLLVMTILFVGFTQYIEDLERKFYPPNRIKDFIRKNPFVYLASVAGMAMHGVALLILYGLFLFCWMFGK